MCYIAEIVVVPSQYEKADRASRSSGTEPRAQNDDSRVNTQLDLPFSAEYASGQSTWTQTSGHQQVDTRRGGILIASEPKNSSL